MDSSEDDETEASGDEVVTSPVKAKRGACFLKSVILPNKPLAGPLASETEASGDEIVTSPVKAKRGGFLAPS